MTTKPNGTTMTLAKPVELSKHEKNAINREIRSIQKYAKYTVMLLEQRTLTQATRDWLTKELKKDNAKLVTMYEQGNTPFGRQDYYYAKPKT